MRSLQASSLKLLIPIDSATSRIDSLEKELAIWLVKAIEAAELAAAALVPAADPPEVASFELVLEAAAAAEEEDETPTVI